MDHPLLVISFYGVMGDFARYSLFPQQNDSTTIFTRVCFQKGMQFLSNHFQVIVFVNNPIDITDISAKDGSDKIKQILSQNNITVDAVYSTNSSTRMRKDQVGEDFS